MTGWPEPVDFPRWVALLADPVRANRAYWHLVLSGRPALPAVRDGLSSQDDAVRRWSTKALDHLVDETAYPALIEMLDDPVPAIRVEALHALACDRCKDDGCRPAPHDVLSKAIELVTSDPDAHVRAYACELVGRWVHTHPDAADALAHVRDTDPSPAVRKKAGWHAPGGTIHRRTTPRSRRR